MSAPVRVVKNFIKLKKANMGKTIRKTFVVSITDERNEQKEQIIETGQERKTKKSKKETMAKPQLPQPTKHI